MRGVKCYYDRDVHLHYVIACLSALVGFLQTVKPISCIKFTMSSFRRGWGWDFYFPVFFSSSSLFLRSPVRI